MSKRKKDVEERKKCKQEMFLGGKGEGEGKYIQRSRATIFRKNVSQKEIYIQPPKPPPPLGLCKSPLPFFSRSKSKLLGPSLLQVGGFSQYADGADDGHQNGLASESG